MSIPRTITELEKIKKECIAMVNKRATASGIISAVPIPLLDAAADVGMMYDLMKKINRKFGLTSEQVDELDDFTRQVIYNVVNEGGKAFIKTQINKLGKKAGEEAVKRMVVSLMKKQSGKIATKTFGKFIPIVGQVAAAGVGFTAMKLAGHSHINDCYEVVLNTIQRKEAM